MSVKPTNIELLAGKADNIYEAIVILSKRARQINEELKIEFNQRVEILQAKQIDPEEEADQPQTNPDQILIAKEFEHRSKPTETALQEVLDDRLAFRYKEDELPPATT
jgi:DNA-directed RNA polymerase subunit K/omega